ncbi:MAG: 50S ribosomal protein L30, partial [Amoebophilaceae bacterium]|nr:50S ribosomal protein L30 [Amoebophilaceae bacterium]
MRMIKYWSLINLLRWWSIQMKTIESLGLGKRDKSVEVEYTPQIQGMVRKVS